MALSDPFGTTYEGSYKSGLSLGQGLQTAAGAFAGKIEENKKKQQTLDMMKQFGIIKPKSATIDDYKAAAEQHFGVGKGGLYITPGQSPEEQVSAASKMFKAMGLPEPQGKGVQVDLDQASKMGASFSSDLSKGVDFKPTPTMDFSSQLAARSQFKTMQDQGLIDKDADISFDTKGKPVVKSKSGMGAAYVREAQKIAPIIADQIESGDVAGYQNSPAWVKAEVAVEMQNRGKKLDPKVLGYGAEKSAMSDIRVVNQKVQNGISAQVLLDASYDPKTGNYNIAPSQHAELAIAVARMLSPTGVVSDDRVNELRQKTAREGFASALIYAGADPSKVGGSTQSVINMFAKLIKRETEMAQKVRDKYVEGELSTLDEFTAPKSVTDVAGISGAAKQPKTQSEYDALPSGSVYVDTDGKTKRKK